MTEDEITGANVDAAYKVHTRLGPGLLEFVYEAVLAKRPTRASLKRRVVSFVTGRCPATR